MKLMLSASRRMAGVAIDELAKASRGRVGLRLLLICLGAVVALALIFWPLSYLALPAKHLHGKDKADAVNATRQVLLIGAGGAVAVLGLYVTVAGYYLSRRGQHAVRYSEAYARLNSQNLVERIGAVLALEHIMRESPADHEAIVSVMSNFIRERAPIAGDDVLPRPVVPLSGARVQRAVPFDIQAALTAVGRRPKRRESFVVNLRQTDLSCADLRGLDFSDADLFGTVLDAANLSGTRFRGAELGNASLDYALMKGADLTRAQLLSASFRQTALVQANLNRAELSAARMHGASLTKATLRKAHLFDTHLIDANLMDADLSHAHLEETHVVGAWAVRANFTHADLSTADLTRSTFWGANFRHAKLDTAILRGARFAGGGLFPDATGLTDRLNPGDIDGETILPASVVVRPTDPPGIPH